MNQEELELLRKYLKGKATPAEEKFIRGWLIRNKGDENVQQLLANEWIETSADNELDIDMQAAWSEFRQMVKNPTIPSRKTSTTKSFSKRKPRAFVIVSVIAILVSAALPFFVFKQVSSVPDTEVESLMTYSIKKTNRGEKLNVSLPDGSFIKLNSSTELRIPENYNTTNERVVYLQGEAFFEIARNEHKPFKVISGNITTEVLGTSFNVNSFSANEDVKVAVVSGKVKVSNNNSKIVLHAKEMTTVGPATKDFSKSDFDIEFISGWRNNILIFDKISFEEILERLKEWYGVDFVIEGKPQHAGKYSGRFENKSLQSVLEGIGFSSAFEYKIKDKKVYIKFK